jgi:adenylate cyclase
MKCMPTSQPEARESRWVWLVPTVALAVALGIIVANPMPLRGLRNATFDQYQRWHPRGDDALPVQIVDIDDESLQRIGQWPWPRERVAQLIDEINRQQPASTAMDIVFAEPDRTDQSGHSASDDQLARSLARGNVAIGFAMTAARVQRDGSAAPREALQLKASYLVLGGDPIAFVREFASSVSNLPQLQDAAAGQGSMTFIPDDDGVVRQVPLLMNLDGQLVPSLAAEALRLAAHATTYTVHSAGDRGGVVDVRIGGRTIATDASGALWVHYARPHPERYIPAWQVLAHQVPAEALKGRIVLVGSSAQGEMDLRFSPRGGVVPGVEVHAQALEQVLDGQQLGRPGWTPAFEWLATLLSGLLVGALAIRRGAAASTTGFLILAVLMCVGAWAFFLYGHVLVDPLVPSLGLALVFVPTALFKHLLIERKQRWIKQAFSRYVSPNLVDYLIAHPETLTLGGKRQRCSFVFADLAGFTTLMEKMDPTAAVSVLNGYLDRMIAIAFEHGGTLDRIVGDAVAIVFSAPIEQVDHERRALRCALRMHVFARRYVDDLAAQGTAFCQTRIGVHSGEVTVGNFGGGAIFDYRALGDPVNVAARLESANKHLGTLLCVSEATLQACPDVHARPIGRLRLAGRIEPVMTYQPLDEGEPPDEDYGRAFERLRDGSAEALPTFEALALLRPMDPLVQLHLARLRAGLLGDEVHLTEK